MKKIISQLARDFPNLRFEAASGFRWSPSNKTIYFQDDKVANQTNLLQVLHELGHATLNHQTFSSSIGLVKMELAAWAVAKRSAAHYHIGVDQDYIESCLDSYRDWLHRRSACPSCSAIGLELKLGHFKCFNCGGAWRVSHDQLKNCYRMRATNLKGRG